MTNKYSNIVDTAVQLIDIEELDTFITTNRKGIIKLLAAAEKVLSNLPDEESRLDFMSWYWANSLCDKDWHFIKPTKIKTLGEYQRLAEITCAPLPTKDQDLIHFRMGVITEIGEALNPIKKWLAYGASIDWVNVQEEIGDIMWFVINEYRVRDFNLSNFSLVVVEKYNKEIDKKEMIVYELLMITLRNYVTGMNSQFIIEDLYDICNFMNWDFWQILTNNIDKLERRFKGKFDAYYALHRNLSKEREELEK